MSFTTKPYKDWTLAEAKAFCAERGQARKDGYDPCEKCPLWEALCAGAYPEKWRLNRFTTEEVANAKAFMMLFPTATELEAGQVFVGATDTWFPTLKPGEKATLNDIIGDGE